MPDNDPKPAAAPAKPAGSTGAVPDSSTDSPARPPIRPTPPTPTSSAPPPAHPLTAASPEPRHDAAPVEPEFVPAPQFFVRADPVDATENEPEPPVLLNDDQAKSQGLVKMMKDGQILHVNLTAVADHHALGWVTVPYKD